MDDVYLKKKKTKPWTPVVVKNWLENGQEIVYNYKCLREIGWSNICNDFLMDRWLDWYSGVLSLI